MADFLDGAFGPNAPIYPMGIDAPRDDSDRPEPRRSQYPVSWNMPRQPGAEGLKLADFATLRFFAESYSIARACITTRIEEIIALEWDIGPTDEAEKNMRNDKAMHKDFQERRAKLVKFFKNPDPVQYDTYEAWLGALLEEWFVIDAVALYLHPSKKKGKGLMGTDLAALELLDGSTIRPLLTMHGSTPRPPAVAYQQYIWGVPRVDLMAQIYEDEENDLGEPSTKFRADQLMYLRYKARPWTPYGFSPLEQAILPVMIGLKRQQYQLDFFDASSVPAVYMVAGPDVATAAQREELELSLNAIAGDQEFKHRIIVLPNGSQPIPQKALEMADQWDEVIMTQVLMAFAVQPSELGISPKVTLTPSAGASKTEAKSSSNINDRKAIRPMLQRLKASVFDKVIQRVCGQDDMEWKWKGLEEEEDLAAKLEMYAKGIPVGIWSVDEVRVDMGQQPWGLAMTSDPVFIGAAGPIPFGNVNPQDEADEEAFPQEPIVDPGAESEDQPTSIVPQSPSNAPTNGPQAPTDGAKPPTNPPTGANKPAQGETPLHSGSEGANTPKPNTAVSGNEAKKPGQKQLALAELESLRRRLKKNRKIDTWKPVFLTESIVKSLASDAETIGHEAAIAKARKKVAVKSRLDRRETALNPIRDKIATDIKALAVKEFAASGSKAKSTFVTQAQAVLKNGYQQAWAAGSDDSSDDYGVDASDEDSDAIDAKVDKQKDYLAGLFTAIIALDVASDVVNSLGSRIDQYADGTQSIYEQGYGQTATDGGYDSIDWENSGDDKVCGLCLDNTTNGPYTMDTLPGWPGDGGFGDLCEGAMNDRCVLLYSQSGGEATE